MNEPNSTPQPRRRTTSLGWGTLLIAVLAVAVAAGSYLAGRDQVRQLRTELSRKLAEFQNKISEDSQLSIGSKASWEQLSQRLGKLEDQVTKSKEQRLALDVLYKELSRDRDQWALAEIEQILLTVNQQLQLEGNVKAAILGLEMADSRLARRDLPQFIRLRAAIAKDLAALRSVPQVDYTGLSIRLNNLAAGVDSWPLVSQATAQPTKPVAPKPRGLGQDVLDEFKNIIQIRRLDQGEPALLNPGQEYFLRQNLKLRLLTARLSLLNRDEANFTADITACEKLLDRYFNADDERVAAARKQLAKLSSVKVSPPLPGIEASLGTLQQLRQAGISN
jgi:uroporphyrin-3 C-methyltransferase